MTALFHDAHKQNKSIKKKAKIKYAKFTEILFADDTICITGKAKYVNKLLKLIQKEGKKYGLNLNKNKCELLKLNTGKNIVFGPQEYSFRISKI